jgi:DNA-directed RNA polymerase subunit RPC12/RpoP
MSKKLKTLQDHNVDARERHDKAFAAFGKPRLNGIACPQCGNELYDSNPSVTLTISPAQKNIHCEDCDYVGYRIA